ncbi:hypothetical protein V6N12_035873 [Hibiscus sabdariffa]|uniref:Uncharacterized protein n=1 Tax=Hibiscus sabdariffa TaxID=183260 RepID=A0ABR2ERH3_9ROSI
MLNKGATTTAQLNGISKRNDDRGAYTWVAQPEIKPTPTAKQNEAKAWQRLTKRRWRMRYRPQATMATELIHRLTQC